MSKHAYFYRLPRERFHLLVLCSCLTSDAVITGPDDNFPSFSLQFLGILPISLLSSIYLIDCIVAHVMTLLISFKYLLKVKQVYADLN